MKKLSVTLLLLAIMIISISAVSAADDVSDDLVMSQTDLDALEIDSVDEDVSQAAEDVEILSEGTSKNFTQLQSDLSGGFLNLGSDYVRAEGESEISISNSVVIIGNGAYKIDANNLGGIFNVGQTGTLILNNVVLVNGNSDNGGAIYNEGILTVMGSTLTGNKATNLGGAIYSTGNLVVDGSNLNDNTATYSGGAIYADGGEIVLTKCVLDNNDVTEITTNDNSGGAAIFAKNAQVTLTNTNVTNNGKRELDRSNGDLVNAVINLLDSNAAITGGLFENNTGIYGGAINADGDGTQTLTVNGATFNNNKAYNGAAININDMVTTIDDSTFTNNLVVGPGSPGYASMGGAIAVDGIGSLAVSDSTFTANSATGTDGSAGAIGIATDEEGFTATIDKCIFKENTAVNKGGAVFASALDVTISDSTFSDDNEAEIGNAIYNGGYLALSDNTISSDSVEIYSAGKITSSSLVIVNNNNPESVDVEYYDSIPVVVKITDDAGNFIRIDTNTLGIRFGNNGVFSEFKSTYNEETGLYEANPKVEYSGLLTPLSTTLTKYLPNYKQSTDLKSVNVNMVKADPTLEVYYDNVSYPDDVVITINLTGKEGAPKISWAATAATPFKVTVNNETYKVKITSGIGTLTIPDLPAGDYVINASWDGNTKYNGIEPQLYDLVVTPKVGTYSDLQYKIDHAENGALDLTYDFAYDETYDGDSFPNGVVIDDSIAINGNGYTISGSNNAALFNVSTGATLTLNNVTVRDTKADKGAGAYVSEGATLDATNVNFISNTATTKGGAIYSEGTVNLNHATIKDNKISKKDGVMADDNGGAAIYNKAGTVTLNDTNVISNQADYVQGDIMDGVIVVMGTATINNSYIADNHGRWGGAITVTETAEALTVENTVFEENTAIFGGAIFHDTGSLTVNDCKFYNNSGVGYGSSGTSSTQGGAILVMGEDPVAVDIKGSEFINNTADLGGAVSISSGVTGTFAIDDCTFTENKANDYGGAVYKYTGDSTLEISNSEFTKNTAVYGGAILAIPEGGIDVDDCTFTDNTASSEGGALYLCAEDGAVATVKDSKFSGNTAPWGNAISNDGTLVLSNNTISTTSADIANYFGEIISPIYVEVMENKTYSYHMSDVALTAVVTDDNGNLIRDINFDFTIGDDDTVYAGYSDGIYSATYTPTVPGTYVVNMSYPSDNLVVKTATLVFSRSLTDLANIVAAADAGATVVLDGDYAYIAEFDEGLEDGIVIDKDITIDGKGFIICGNDSARLFNVASGTLTLNNVTICDGAAADGAAVKVGSGAKLVANDAIFKDNVAENNGGAIYTDGGEIDLTNCVLDNNDVTEITTNDNSGGAAIYAKNAQVTLTNTNVTNNGKKELDRTNNDLVNAVINLLDSSATITGGLFENNTGIYGGAINADGDGTQTLTVTGATFNNNKAYNGAAINLHDMKTTIDDSTFTNNLVVGPGSPGYYAMGGAISVDGIGSLDVSDSTFIANSATGTNASAGAIGISTVEDDFTATIDNCTFEQNTAVLKGGAVFANAVDVTISDSTFSDDNEAGNGNAIYNGGNLKLSNNTVNSDSAEIFTAGKINTDERVIVTVNGVHNVDAVFYDSIPVVLKITDDNGNLIDIDESSITIDLPSGTFYRTTIYKNEETGFFEGDVIVKKSGLLTPNRLVFLKYFNSYNANTHLNSTYVNMIKANATLNTTYENITYPGDVVITFNLTGKEGAPAVACPASRFVVTINDVEYKVKITDGIGTLTVSDLPMGNYTIDVAWTGHQGSDLGYNPITASYPLEVSAKKGTYTDLRYQIDHAENGVLDLPYDFAYDETYDGANFLDGILISESIAINANGHEISGCSTAALFNVATDVTLNLNNVTIRDTKADKGAAVYVNEGATLKADHVTFSNNTATYRGGAIYSEGTVDVDNSVFDKNDITYRAKNEDNGGAAIYNLGGTLTIAHSNITNSVKDIVIRNGNAGDLLNGVIVTSGDTLITDSYFANNTGSYGGAITSCGGLNSEDYTLTVKNTVFEGNNATFGGAIFVESSELIVDNCTFENNKGVGVGSPGTSYTQGGAIVVFPNGAKATITDSTFTGNSADLGGAVSLPGVDQDSLIENCTFTDNTASADGGAIYLWTSGSAAVTVADSTFSGNTADRGNAILTDGVLKLSNNTISKTRADVEINYGIIDSFINATFLGNQTIPAHLGDKVVLNATLTDDNGNTIYDPYFKFAVNGQRISDIVFDEDTGLFTYEYTIESAGEKVISTNYNYGGIEKFIGILDVPKANATLYVTTGQNDQFPYGENVTVFIGLYDDYSGVGLNDTVTVIINNTPVSVTITDGEGSFNVSGFEPGKYSVLGTFAGNDNYNGPVYDSSVFEVLFPDRILSIEVDDIKFGEVAIINITVKDANGDETSGMVVLTVNGTEYAVRVDGKESVEISGLDVNEAGYVVNATLLEEGLNAAVVNDTESFTVGINTLSFTIEATQDAAYPDDVTITVTSDVDGTAHVTVEGNDGYSTEFDVNVEDGVGTYVLSGLVPDSYEAAATYTVYGYDEQEGNTTFEVVKGATSFTAEGKDITYGETAYVYVTDLPEDATGNVTVTIDGVPYTADVEYGFAVVEIPDLAVGDYELFAVEYSGDSNYEGHTGMATISVTPASSSVTIDDIADVTYNASVEVTYAVENETTVTVVVKDAEGTEITTGVNTTTDGKVIITGLSAGEYTITVSNAAEGNYSASSDEATFKVLKATVTIDPEATGDFVAGGMVNVTFTVPTDIDGMLSVTIDGEPVLAFLVVNGTCTIPGTYDAGSHNVVVTLTGDTNYEDATGSTKFDMGKADPTIEPVVEAGNYGDVTNITVNIDSDATQYILISIDGNNVGFDEIDGGVVKVSVADLGAGEHNLTVTYTGDDKYNKGTANATFTIGKAASSVVISPIENATSVYDIVVEYEVVNETALTFIVKDQDGVEITSGIDTSVAGKVTISGLDDGNYTITIVNAETDNYNGSSATAEFAVNDVVTVLSAGNLTMRFKDGSSWIATLTDVNGNPVSGAEVVVSVVGKEYKRTTNSKGEAILPINLNPGVYDISATYAGDKHHLGSSANGTITVGKGLATLSASDINMTYQDGSGWLISLTDSYGNPISGATIEVGIVGKVYNIKTNNSGIAKLPVKLYPGTYAVNASLNNAKYEAEPIEGVVTVDKAVPVLTGADVVADYGGQVYNVTLTDAAGSPIDNVVINITVDGKTYQSKTDANGVASVSLNLGAGSHTVTAKFVGTVRYSEVEISNTIVVNKPEMSIAADNITMTYKDGTAYTVQLVDTDGNPIALAGEYINITIKDKTYSRKTNASGIASLPINLAAGEHTLIAEYEGHVITSKVIVNKP